MDPFLVGIISVVALLILLALGVHIALALLAVGLIGNILILGFEPSLWLAVTFGYSYLSKSAFIVLPLFIFMGLLAGSSGISANLYDALKLWVGKVRAGLAITTVFSCTAFGVCTGSSLVTSAVFTRICAPEMRRQGYSKNVAYGTCTAAGSIGMLIPPSILLVVYGLISEESVGKLLMAGIAPGVMLAIFFILGLLIMSKINPALFGTTPPIKATWRQRIASIRLMWPILFIGFVIIGSIFLGIASPTEAGALGTVAITILALATTGNERWKILKKGMAEAVTINAMVFFLLIGAGVFARLLMVSGVTHTLINLVIDAGLSNLQFVIVMALIYLAMGCLMDSISMLSITLPLVIPIVHMLNIPSMWFAMVSVLAIEVGLITPPVGLNAYAAKGVAEPDVSLEDIFRACIPFLFMMLGALVVIIAFPWLSEILPKIMLGD